MEQRLEQPSEYSAKTKEDWAAGGSMEEWCIPIDKELYDAATKLCEELGTTLEEVTVAFLKFCIVPENLPKVKEILGLED